MYDQTNVNQTCLRTSKRRKGFPSETHVRRGLRIVHTDRTIGKLGRYDPCSFGSERRFERCFLKTGSYDAKEGTTSIQSVELAATA